MNTLSRMSGRKKKKKIKKETQRASLPSRMEVLAVVDQQLTALRKTNKVCNYELEAKILKSNMSVIGFENF